jgi:hypothetical protein
VSTFGIQHSISIHPSPSPPIFLLPRQAALLLLFNETPEMKFQEVQEKLNLPVSNVGWG